MTFQFWLGLEGESSGAQGAPLLSPSPIKNLNVIPNEAKRNEESLYLFWHFKNDLTFC